LNPGVPDHTPGFLIFNDQAADSHWFVVYPVRDFSKLLKIAYFLASISQGDAQHGDGTQTHQVLFSGLTCSPTPEQIMTAGVAKLIYGTDGNGLSWIGNSGNDQIYAGTGDQTLYGNAGDDMLVAGTGNQMLYGGSGTDYIVAGYGNQTLDGGSGNDTVDFSRLNGKLIIDQDLYTATLVDPTTGAVMCTYSVKSFNALIGTNYGTDVHGQANTANTYTFGAGNDRYYSESGGDLITGGAGADTYSWMKKYASVGHVDTVTDFLVGTDKLDMSDFLKGQLFKSPAYDQVVRLADMMNIDGSHSTMVQTLTAGFWHDTVVLAGVNMGDVGADHHALTLFDLGISK
jgi:RTX calcium-binding nonapeptide repeat (4 copies)/Peptidase M10 serralysin C terminal